MLASITACHIPLFHFTQCKVDIDFPMLVVFYNFCISLELKKCYFTSPLCKRYENCALFFICSTLAIVAAALTKLVCADLFSLVSQLLSHFMQKIFTNSVPRTLPQTRLYEPFSFAATLRLYA